MTVRYPILHGESKAQRRRRLRRDNQRRASQLAGRAIYRRRGEPVDRVFIMARCFIDPSTQCWEWQRARKPFGYGILYENGKLIIAHRKAYELWVGLIPEGMCVLHKCDVPQCCNPKHLFLGTYKDNRIDCVRKRRHGHVTRPETIPRGENHGRSKLTNETVVEIRRLHSTGVNQREIGRRLSVGYKNINKIVNGVRWRHIS